MSFKNVIGQAITKRRLVELLQSNRLSHALLFLGQEGSGALPLAIAFAQYVSLLPGSQGGAKNKGAGALFADDSTQTDELGLFASPAEADEWMARQPGYSKAEALIHPDIHFSYPVFPKKSGDKPLSTD